MQTKQDKKRLFTYAFALMDLETHMYVGYGASLRSKKAAFEAALKIMRECGVKPKSIRLDQYYAGQSTASYFDADTAVYVVPKSNATIRGSYAWKDMIRDFMFYPFCFCKSILSVSIRRAGSRLISGVMVGIFGRGEKIEYRLLLCSRVYGIICFG